MQNVNIGSTPLIGKIQRWGMILAAVGALGMIAVFATGGEHGLQRLMADYLIGFWYFAGISVTMVFFSALQYLARAGWSSPVRRIAENFSGLVPFLGIGMLPIIANLFAEHSIYEWSTYFLHAGHPGAHFDPILDGKSQYLNPTFFIVRMALYALLWFGFMKFIVGNSVKQDTASDLRPTEKNWKRSAPFVLLYAITITFASFDLLMSLEPHWFSTIWGVYTFAGHFVASLAIITLMVVALYRNGLLRGYIRGEHFHDLGKLMFAFSVFWTYIAFSQYFIIWYANLPEETIYFTFRTDHGWQIMAIALVVTHFLLPFALLLRQSVKRKTTMLVVAAIVILISHFIDMSWIIMPAVSKVIHHGEPGNHGMLFGWQEITGVLFFGGLFMMAAVRNFKKRNAVAINDPMIAEAAEYFS